MAQGLIVVDTLVLRGKVLIHITVCFSYQQSCIWEILMCEVCSLLFGHAHSLNLPDIISIAHVIMPLWRLGPLMSSFP